MRATNIMHLIFVCNVYLLIIAYPNGIVFVVLSELFLNMIIYMVQVVLVIKIILPVKIELVVSISHVVVHTDTIASITPVTTFNSSILPWCKWLYAIGGNIVPTREDVSDIHSLL